MTYRYGLPLGDDDPQNAVDYPECLRCGREHPGRCARDERKKK